MARPRDVTRRTFVDLGQEPDAWARLASNRNCSGSLTMKILLAVDGSQHSQKAVKVVLKLAESLRSTPELLLFHADVPLLQMAAAKMGSAAVTRYHHENGVGATRKAAATLKRAGLAHQTLLKVGDAAPAILQAAKAQRCDMIVMGSRGHGALESLLVGSVAVKVIAQSSIPVVVVR